MYATSFKLRRQHQKTDRRIRNASSSGVEHATGQLSKAELEALVRDVQVVMLPPHGTTAYLDHKASE